MQVTQESISFENEEIVETNGSRTELPGYRLFYEQPNGKLYCGNSFDWLRSLENESVDLVFADPPYNIRKAEWDSFESQEAYIHWSVEWIEQAARILKPHGS